jgi:hypothetical protein
MNDIPPNRLITVEMPINLIDRTEVDEFLDVLREGTQDAEKILFVFDTWQRMTQRAESQSNEHDMAQAITNVEYMSKSVRGPSIGAFHPPKNNADTISGSSLIENTSHAILQVADVGAGNQDTQVDPHQGCAGRQRDRLRDERGRHRRREPVRQGEQVRGHEGHRGYGTSQHG